MGMSTDIIGLVSSDDKTYQKHAKVLQACIDADIQELPKETADYFGSKYPDEELLEAKLSVEIPKHKYQDESSSGFEIYISSIPKGVNKIRFVNSW